jgi:hypothetical protein
MKSSQHKRASHFEPVATTGLGIIVPGACPVQEHSDLLCSARSSGQVATVANLAALEGARLTGAAEPERAGVFVGDTFGGAASTGCGPVL